LGQVFTVSQHSPKENLRLFFGAFLASLTTNQPEERKYEQQSFERSDREDRMDTFVASRDPDTRSGRSLSITGLHVNNK
jgi:hypothetical protein